jgi:hypothetical protein
MLLLQLPLTAEAGDRPYKIWVKGVRNDSTESADSAIIVWSGAQAVGGITPPYIEIGKKIFIGQTNLTYELKQADDPAAQIGVTSADSTITITAFAGAKFAERIDVSILDSVYFGAPLAEAVFTETSLTLPRNPVSSVCFYVLFAEGTRARVMFIQNPNQTLIHQNNSIQAKGIFQTKGSFNLPYF